MKKLHWVLYLLFATTVLIVGCKKDEDDNTGTSVLNIRLTDAPAAYDAVNVEIVGVEVTGANGKLSSLNVNPGIYNLLDFTNGNDTLIATGALASGKVQQIRLILGNNNSVVVDSVTYPLATPSAQQSGLKLQVHKDLIAGVAYSLLLDFDAHQSVVDMGNGNFNLKPVIRVVDQAISGAIKGTIAPAGLICSVTADDGTNQYSTYNDSTGGFILMGVPAGTYSLTVSPDPPLLPQVLNNIVVTTGQLTDAGTINF
jgi:hypothetical protein